MLRKKELETMLTELQGDDRLKQPPATIDINLPLAMIQSCLKSNIDLLRQILKTS